MTTTYTAISGLLYHGDQVYYGVNSPPAPPPPVVGPPPPPVSPPPAPPPVNPAILFNANVGSAGLGNYALQADPGTITVVDDPVLGSARKVLNFTVADNQTAGVTGNPRAQCMTPMKWVAGQDLYVGWGLYLPPNFPKFPSNGWMTLGEFYGPPWGGHSPFLMGIAPNLGGGGVGVGGITIGAPPTTGKWIDFVIHEFLSTDPTKGFVEVFVNTGSGLAQHKFDAGTMRYMTATLGPANAGGPNYYKQANYRQLGMFPTLTTYQTGLVVATNLALADPHSYG